MDAPPNEPVRRIFVVGLPREVVAGWFRADLEAFGYEF